MIHRQKTFKEVSFVEGSRFEKKNLIQSDEPEHSTVKTPDHKSLRDCRSK